MSDLIEPKGQDPAPAAAPASPEPAQTPAETWTDGTPFDAKRARELLTKLEAEAKEGKKASKELAALKDAEQKRKEAELSELERANKRIAELEAKTLAAERRELQNSVAAKVGLPAAFASRIQGETEDDMEADAKALLAAMPAAVPPKGNPTNPGQPQTGETREERRKRLGL